MLAMLARQRQQPNVSAPGPGNFADSITRVSSVIPILQQAAMGFQPGSREWKIVHQAVGQLGKIGQSGQPGVGVQKTFLQDALMATLRNQILPAMLQSRRQSGPGAPAPSMPLPGA